jgi:hypothetical protein
MDLSNCCSYNYSLKLLLNASRPSFRVTQRLILSTIERYKVGHSFQLERTFALNRSFNFSREIEYLQFFIQGNRHVFTPYTSQQLSRDTRSPRSLESICRQGYGSIPCRRRTTGSRAILKGTPNFPFWGTPSTLLVGCTLPRRDAEANAVKPD